MKWLNMEYFEKLDNEDRAIMIAEHYGIMNYVVIEDEFIFFEQFVYNDKVKSYKEIINLDSLEDKRRLVKDNGFLIYKAMNIQNIDTNMPS